ncbi:hypothetical protein D3C78_1517470 [compost metagenome]
MMPLPEGSSRTALSRRQITRRAMPKTSFAFMASRMTLKASVPILSSGRRKCGRSYQIQSIDPFGTKVLISMVRVLSSATASISSSSSNT